MGLFRVEDGDGCARVGGCGVGARQRLQGLLKVEAPGWGGCSFGQAGHDGSRVRARQGWCKGWIYVGVGRTVLASRLLRSLLSVSEFILVGRSVGRLAFGGETWGSGPNLPGMIAARPAFLHRLVGP